VNFLLDQGLPRSTVRHLRAAGLAAVHVGDIGLAEASDARILEEGLRRQSVVVTLDADFHALLAITRAVAPSVVRIRIEGLRGEELGSLLQEVASRAGSALGKGAAVSVTAKRIRVRMLPVGG
jgi:predicted nuclease of predicted toxin-antitoxin system